MDPGAYSIAEWDPECVPGVWCTDRVTVGLWDTPRRHEEQLTYVAFSVLPLTTLVVGHLASKRDCLNEDSKKKKRERDCESINSR